MSTAENSPELEQFRYGCVHHAKETGIALPMFLDTATPKPL